MESVENTFFFVIFPEDGVWVAHGLQHNIVTHGDSLLELRENIDILFDAYVDSNDLYSIPRAESDLWSRFEVAKAAGRNLDDFLKEEVEPDTFTLELQTA